MSIKFDDTVNSWEEYMKHVNKMKFRENKDWQSLAMEKCPTVMTIINAWGYEDIANKAIRELQKLLEK